MNDNGQKLTAWFQRFDQRMDTRIPTIIGETANEYYKESFRTKSFGGKTWKGNKKPGKKGSQMVRSGALVSSIRPATISPNLVRMSAGNSKVQYAKIQNMGDTIIRRARSETFVRNRYKVGAKSKYFGGMGAFKKGTTPGQGLSFKAYTITIPQRQFMGHTAELNKRIIKRIKSIF